ncbi:unnamed protein product [Fusarium equiseti]|uniref:NYN domain-containing protein n=1 Tax=Fusarium equiseti TaxID=61235 RepID=A0A8J2IP57_FUSEQ|nr:unnamed protein product [Fusarium equiseti]
MAYQASDPLFGASINIYMDDSNIAIGGRRFYKIYREKHPEAPRRRFWYYDFEKLGKIMKELAKQYGWSENDPTIHKQYNFYGANLNRNPQLRRLPRRPDVKLYHCKTNGQQKEKAADCKLTADFTDRVKSTNRFVEAAYFVVLSGDADMVPAVEKAMKYGFVVHIWSWDESLSGQLERLEKDHRGLVKVHKLNERIVDFTL